MYAQAGCLTRYGSSFVYSFQRAAFYVDKIFSGVKPGDLPAEQPTKFDLVINSTHRVPAAFRGQARPRKPY